MADQVKVTIVEPDGNRYDRWTLKGKSVWEAMEMLGWDTHGACGGQGTCGKCKFRLAGAVSGITPAEREHLIPEEIKNGQRLACLATIEGDFTLFIDYWTGNEGSKQALLRYHPVRYTDSPVAIKDFYIPGRLQAAHTPLYDRVKAALPGCHLQLNMANLNDLAALDRPGRPALELHAIIMEGQKVPYIGRQRENVYGLALDIGSTSLFAALVDLQTGGIAAMGSHSNMQRIYGEDIISRITYATEQPEGASVLHKILINNLNSMITEMLQDLAISSDNIYRVMAVGNPVMLHLLLGLNVQDLGRAPYLGIFGEDIETSAADLGLQVNPLGQIRTLPQLGGFVGADTTACLLTLASAAEDTYLLIDIGTNGEIVLHHDNRMWAASAAAGPAFEGGAISCGMRAGQGAIDKVTSSDKSLVFRVIGAGSPRGICGSGLIDLAANLLRNGILDRNGNIVDSPGWEPMIRSGAKGPELVLVDEGESFSGVPLLLNQEDVRQLQLARSAIRTAIEILMEQAGITSGQLQRVYLAGVFGSYLDPASVLEMGLIPAVDRDKIKNLGNAAAEGAIMALLSQHEFAKAALIKTRVQYIELADQAKFQELFIRNLNF